MISAIKLILASLLGNFVARVLSGAGLAIVTGAALTPVVTTALDAAAAGLGGISGNMLQVVNMGGIGECMSIIGSAMLTRTVINAGRVGLKKVASA